MSYIINKIVMKKVAVSNVMHFRFVFFCFANLINYRIPSGLGAPFSLTTLFEECSPA